MINISFGNAYCRATWIRKTPFFFLFKEETYENLPKLWQSVPARQGCLTLPINAAHCPYTKYIFVVVIVLCFCDSGYPNVVFVYFVTLRFLRGYCRVSVIFRFAELFSMHPVVLVIINVLLIYFVIANWIYLRSIACFFLPFTMDHVSCYTLHHIRIVMIRS